MAMRTFVNEFVGFMDKACTNFHAVSTVANMYDAAGFTRITETDEWELKPTGKYYFTRNM
jgi:aspartyl aminopeptidase